jgi:hypothetical protein
MAIECSRDLFAFATVEGGEVVAAFDGAPSRRLPPLLMIVPLAVPPASTY